PAVKRGGGAVYQVAREPESFHAGGQTDKARLPSDRTELAPRRRTPEGTAGKSAWPSVRWRAYEVGLPKTCSARAPLPRDRSARPRSSGAGSSGPPPTVSGRLRQRQRAAVPPAPACRLLALRH